MPTVLITGASKGIGLEFAKQYAAADWNVVATYRGSGSEALQALGKVNANVRLEKLEVGDVRSMESLAKRLSGEPLDVLINNAGRMGSGNDPTKANGETLGNLQIDLFQEYIITNTYGPIKMVELFRDHLMSGRLRKVVTISSNAGSNQVSETLPGHYWYKASKAAVNRVMVTAARDLKADGITVLMFHPGLVITERLEPVRERLLKIPGNEKPFEMDEAVGAMISTIERSTLADSGSFLTNQGQKLPF